MYRCGGPEALPQFIDVVVQRIYDNFVKSASKKTSSGRQDCYILKTHLEFRTKGAIYTHICMHMCV